jgi:beta-galactosidase GanA
MDKSLRIENWAKRLWNQFCKTMTEMKKPNEKAPSWESIIEEDEEIAVVFRGLAEYVVEREDELLESLKTITKNHPNWLSNPNMLDELIEKEKSNVL